MKGTRLYDALGEVLAYVKKLEEEITALKHQVRTDRMTGIFNMQAMEEHIAASRYDGYYVFCDMDGMGARNKVLGHDHVNEYIKEFGLWLRTTTRSARDRGPCDAIAIRKHGDEFLVWCSNKKAAIAIKTRIRKWVSEDGEVTCSAGMGRTIQIADHNCSEYKRERKKQAA